MTGTYAGTVGFNPFRKRVDRKGDVLIVVVAVVVVALLVLWAALPR